MQTFKMSSENTAAAVGGAVTQMHSFLTKCQQLNQDLPPIDELAKQMYNFCSSELPLLPLSPTPVPNKQKGAPQDSGHVGNVDCSFWTPLSRVVPGQWKYVQSGIKI